VAGGSALLDGDARCRVLFLPGAADLAGRIVGYPIDEDAAAGLTGRSILGVDPPPLAVV
jgi:hypothetical protein